MSDLSNAKKIGLSASLVRYSLGGAGAGFGHRMSSLDVLGRWLLLHALLEAAQEPFGLIDVAARIRVVWIHLAHHPPLRDGFLQLLLAVEPHALGVVLLDEARARLLEQGGRVLVVGLETREQGQALDRLRVLPGLDLAL